MAKVNAKKKKARRRHAKSCEGKQAMANKKEAMARAQVLRDKRGWTDIGAYECVQCGSWHLGNRSW